jgi:hypothetical protein
METTANDRLLHFMAQPPKVEKHGEFGVTAQFVIEVQPLFIRNSFQQFFACVPSDQPKSLLFKPKWIWNKIPDVIRDRIAQLALDEPRPVALRARSSRTSGHVRKGQFRQNFAVRAMSGLPPIATELRTSWISSFVP